MGYAYEVEVVPEKDTSADSTGYVCNVQHLIRLREGVPYDRSDGDLFHEFGHAAQYYANAKDLTNERDFDAFMNALYQILKANDGLKPLLPELKSKKK